MDLGGTGASTARLRRDRGPEDYSELRELQEGAAAKACSRELLPSLAAALIVCPVAPSLDNEELAALATVASPVTLAAPDLPSSAVTLDSRAVTDAVNWSTAALTAVISGSLSLPTGTAVIVVASVLAEALMAAICAVSLAATSPPDLATEASPWASAFTVAVAVQT